MSASDSHARTIGRYALFQLPELAVGCLVALALVHFEVISVVLGWALLALWLAKDVVLFPFVRKAYEHSDGDAHESLVGARGLVTEPLEPEGWIRVGPELWRARLPAGGGPIRVGVSVRVVGVDQLVLIVESEIQK